MKNMANIITTNIDNSNNNLDNGNLLPFLPPSPNKKIINNINEPNFKINNNNNVTTVVNELTDDHIENINKNDGFLVSPTNSEVSSMNDNNFNEENIKKNTDTDTDTDVAKENIIKNITEITTIINSEIAPIVDTVVIPKKNEDVQKKYSKKLNPNIFLYIS